MPLESARGTLLEDKVAIDAFWDSIGVKRAPSYIVPLTDKSIGVRASKLDLGLGTVWAADARDGYHGGSIGLRWVQTGGEVAETAREMSRFADSVRIMPFLEGVPVSIHGVVFPESVAVFRPVEMIVLRQADRSRFLYAGCSTWFDPISRDRDEMRKTARHVGDSLRSRINYRGPFTIDGVLTADGFIADGTESKNWCRAHNSWAKSRRVTAAADLLGRHARGSPRLPP